MQTKGQQDIIGNNIYSASYVKLRAVINIHFTSATGKKGDAEQSCALINCTKRVYLDKQKYLMTRKMHLIKRKHMASGR